MADGFDPNKSQIGNKAMVSFINEEISMKLTDVPGLGKVGVEKLKAAGIDNTFQLIGKFLMLRKEKMTEKEHCDAMWYWLKSIGVNSHRSGIICALGLKLSVSYPTLFSESTFTLESNAAEEADEVLLKD